MNRFGWAFIAVMVAVAGADVQAPLELGISGKVAELLIRLPYLLISAWALLKAIDYKKEDTK